LKNPIALRPAAAVLAAAAFLFLSACAGTKLQDSWVAPDVTKLSFKNVLVIAVTSDGTGRRAFEDAVVAAAPNTHAVPSYVYFGDKVDIINPDQVTAAVRASKFDGVVVMRLISDRAETTVNQTTYPVGGYGYGMMAPGPSYGYRGGYYGRPGYPAGYGTFGGYYGGYAMTDTTVTTDHIYSIETNVYELPGEKLVWSGLTASTNPGNVKQVAADVVSLIRQQMLKQQLIGAHAK
jgi:hypothetical protein